MARTILAPQQPATFPTVEPAGPGAIPGLGYQRIQAEPASFGGLIGGALQQAGGQIEAGSSALAGAAIQRQDLYNQITADKATTDYMTGVHKQMFGDPSAREGDPARVGLLGMDGPGAMAAAREMPGKLDALREQIASQLPNNYVRETFNAETRRQRIYVDQQIGSHYATQMDRWGKQVQDDRIHSAATGAALNYSDPEQLRQSYSTITDAAVKQVTHDIGGPIDPSNPDHQNRLNVALATGYTLFAKNTIDAALAHNQPEAAQKFLDDWSPWLGLPGTVQEELHNSIRAPLEEATVAGAVDRALGRAPSIGPTGRAGAPSQSASQNAVVIRDTLKARGWSDAAITGALANGFAESGLQTWGDSGSAGEQGIFQFNPSSHLPLFEKAKGGDHSAKAQAEYVADWVDEHMPDYKGISDKQAATDRFMTGFEAPKDATPGSRYQHIATAEKALAGPGARSAQAGPGVPAGTIDKTAEAGFGTKFGALESPQGMIIHHTSGGGDINSVISTFKQTNYPAQFVIDRDGKIYQTLPDGYQGQHIRNSYGPVGEGKTNANMEGVEIIANNDGDVLPVQEEAAARLVAARAAKWGYDPKTSVFGHGEVNPGHKEADEGMSTVTRIRNGTLDVSPPAGAQPVRYAQAGPVTMTDATVGGPSPAPPPAQPLSVGQQTLMTGKPDYPSAIARLEQDTSLSPVDRRRAIAAIRQEMSIDYEIEDRNNRLADKQLRDQQAANEGQLFAKAVRKEPLDQATLSKMLEQRQITPAGYNAIIAEANRPEEGQDNADTVLHLYQRIGNNEDVSQDIYNASQAHAIKGTTAIELIKAVDARKKQVADQTERTAFSTLRTIAGMDAAEHPMIDLGREAQQAQVALWGQAQLEWNQRVVVNKENPMAVLSDMKDRYSHPVLSLESLPRPLSGPIRKVEDIAPRAQQLQDAYERGEVSKDVYDRERGLILQYQDVLDDQNKRKAAKDSVPPVSGGGGARAVGIKPTGTE